jgi:hypothetical protein
MYLVFHASVSQEEFIVDRIILTLKKIVSAVFISHENTHRNFI